MTKYGQGRGAGFPFITLLRVINSLGITSGGMNIVCVCKSVWVCGDELRRGGGVTAKKRERGKERDEK